MHKITIKLFAEQDTFAPAEFVQMFHRWIQTHALAEHLLIDVADYAHVVAGPGTLVVAAEANIHMDRGGNRLGLMYVRKQPIAGAANFRETLAGVLRYALTAADLMEKEQALNGRLKFSTDEISLRFNDRLHTPNNTATFAAIKDDIQAAVDRVLGPGTAISPSSAPPENLLEVFIRKLPQLAGS